MITSMRRSPKRRSSSPKEADFSMQQIIRGRGVGPDQEVVSLPRSWSSTREPNNHTCARAPKSLVAAWRMDVIWSSVSLMAMSYTSVYSF
jgi:hypothetical protein